MMMPSELGLSQAVESMHPGPLRSVGFGSTVPPHSGTERVARESFLEQKAYQEVKAMHERQAAEAQLAENALPNLHGFPTPPFPDYLPPPPGWKHLKKKSTNQIVEPQADQTESEACPCVPDMSVWRQMLQSIPSLIATGPDTRLDICRRRDLYQFTTALRPTSDWEALEEHMEQGTITLDPGAYREFTARQALRSRLRLHSSSIRI